VGQQPTGGPWHGPGRARRVGRARLTRLPLACSAARASGPGPVTVVTCEPRGTHRSRRSQLSGWQDDAKVAGGPSVGREVRGGYDARPPGVAGSGLRATAAAGVAAESVAPWAADPGAADGSGRGWGPARLEAAVDELVGVDLNGYGVDGLQQLLRGLSPQLRRLEGARARITAALAAREETAGASGGRGRAERRAERFLVEELQLDPGDAKRATQTGRRLNGAPVTAAALAVGDIDERHAAVITDTLRKLPSDVRDRAEADLLALARRAPAKDVAREGRRRIAHADAATAEREDARRRTRRAASWRRQEDGGLRLSLLAYGVDAEVAEVALNALLPAPSADDRRSHDQRRADALTGMFRTLLDHGDLPTVHGHRPHVHVTVDLATLETFEGVAELGSGEVVSLAEAAHLIGDSALTRFVLDLDRAAVEASVTSRTVPHALWRALVVRDGGCSWDGCDRPVSWCQVAHGNVPFAAGGALRLDDCALLCGEHHRRFDGGGWRMDTTGGTVTYERDEDRPGVVEYARRLREQDHSAGPDHPGRPQPQPPDRVTEAKPPGPVADRGTQAVGAPAGRTDEGPRDRAVGRGGPEPPGPGRVDDL
jgi:hypothetical protein